MPVQQVNCRVDLDQVTSDRQITTGRNGTHDIGCILVTAIANQLMLVPCSLSTRKALNAGIYGLRTDDVVRLISALQTCLPAMHPTPNSVNTRELQRTINRLANDWKSANPELAKSVKDTRAYWRVESSGADRTHTFTKSQTLKAIKQYVAFADEHNDATIRAVLMGTTYDESTECLSGIVAGHYHGYGK